MCKCCNIAVCNASSHFLSITGYIGNCNRIFDFFSVCVLRKIIPCLERINLQVDVISLFFIIFHELYADGCRTDSILVVCVIPCTLDVYIYCLRYMFVSNYNSIIIQDITCCCNGVIFVFGCLNGIVDSLSVFLDINLFEGSFPAVLLI